MYVRHLSNETKAVCNVVWQCASTDVPYNAQGNPRSTAIRVVAKANKLDLDIVYTKPPSELPKDYLKINPLGKIPTFVGADGYELTEAIAIAIYSMATHHTTADPLP